MSAAALMMFASCDKNGNGDGGFDLDNMIEDGWYVVGDATGYAKATTKCMLTPARNESDSNNPRAGMYEKYLILEGGKTFKVASYESEVEKVSYGATLKEWDVTKFSDYPVGETVYLGELDDNAVTVAETGLYLVVIDLNEDQKLKYPQMMITKVNWGMMGGASAWGDTAFEASEISNGTITYTAKNVECRAGYKYKFRCNNGWKIFLDAEEGNKISANINLGEGLIPGAADMAVGEEGMFDITLKFTQSAGNVEKSFSQTFKKVGDVVVLDPATFAVGFSGEFNGWGTPADGYLATYDASSSNVTDNENKAGTYVFKTAGTALSGAFKVRVNGGWYGGGNSELTVTGASVSGSDNLTIAEAGTYKVVITIEWDGSKATSITVALSK